MPRLLPEEAERAYREGKPSPYVLAYDPDVHEEAMKDLATGLIGALLRMGLEYISGPEIGSPIPMVVTNVRGDMLRIFIDPYVEGYGPEVACNLPRMKKARQHAELTALSYQGEGMYFDTGELTHIDGSRLAAILQLYDRKLHVLRLLDT